MKKRESVLLGSAMTLGIVAFAQLEPEPSHIDSTHFSEASERVVLSPNVFELAPVERFDEVVTRPLFTPTRRPALVEIPANEDVDDTTPVPEAAAPSVRLRLTGVVIEGDDGIALIAHAGKTERLRSGEPVAGWRLETIEPHSVVLERGTERVELALRQFGTDPKPDDTRTTANTTREAVSTEDGLLDLLAEEAEDGLLELLAEGGGEYEDVRPLRPSNVVSADSPD